MPLGSCVADDSVETPSAYCPYNNLPVWPLRFQENLHIHLLLAWPRTSQPEMLLVMSCMRQPLPFLEHNTYFYVLKGLSRAWSKHTSGKTDSGSHDAEFWIWHQARLQTKRCSSISSPSNFTADSNTRLTWKPESSSDLCEKLFFVVA